MKLPYVSLAALKSAHSASRLIKFTAAGKEWTIEPHELAHAPKTKALVVRGRVIEGEHVGEWFEFRYSEMREGRVLTTAFIPQRVPHKLRKVFHTPRRKRLADTEDGSPREA